LRRGHRNPVAAAFLLTETLSLMVVPTMLRRGFTIVEVLVVVFVIGLLIALLLPAIQSAREAARRNTCRANLRNLVLAHLQYHDAQGCFPSQWAFGLSFDVFDGTPPRATPVPFKCPSNTVELDLTHEGLAPYGQNMFLVGTPLRRITDGTAFTILHGEFRANDGTVWFNSPSLTSANCESAHPQGAHYGMVDGRVHFLSTSLAEDVRVYLLLPEDGQVFNSPF